MPSVPDREMTEVIGREHMEVAEAVAVREAVGVVERVWVWLGVAEGEITTRLGGRHGGAIADRRFEGSMPLAPQQLNAPSVDAEQVW